MSTQQVMKKKIHLLNMYVIVVKNLIYKRNSMKSLNGKSSPLNFLLIYFGCFPFSARFCTSQVIRSVNC